MSQKKIVEVKKDKAGNIDKVRFEGNENFTSKEKAIDLADKGKVSGVHVVHLHEGKNIFVVTRMVIKITT
jgi:hypothetical protein